jgi:hypothetical protein
VESGEPHVTASIGFASLTAGMSGPQHLFEDAMEGLRQALGDGGDRVSAAPAD